MILSCKYESVTIGMGEAGLKRDSSDTSISAITSGTDIGPKTVSPKGKNKTTPEETAHNMMKSVINLLYEKEKVASGGSNQDKTNDEVVQCTSTLPDLMNLYDMYMKDFNFHKERGTLTSEREKKTIEKIDNLFAMIEERTSGKKRAHSETNDCNSPVS